MKSSPYAAHVSAYLYVTFYGNISVSPSLQQPGLEATQGWRPLEFIFYFLFFSLLKAGLGGCCLGQHQISDLSSHYINSCGNDKYFDISILDIIGW